MSSRSAAQEAWRRQPEQLKKAVVRTLDWQKRNPERTKYLKAASNRRILYGVEETDYQKMLSNQKGVCAICCCGTKLVVDHDHTTGHVRGLICHDCNVGIGALKDSITRLESAKRYLESFK